MKWKWGSSKKKSKEQKDSSGKSENDSSKQVMTAAEKLTDAADEVVNHSSPGAEELLKGKPADPLMVEMEPQAVAEESLRAQELDGTDGSENSDGLVSEARDVTSEPEETEKSSESKDLDTIALEEEDDDDLDDLNMDLDALTTLPHSKDSKTGSTELNEEPSADLQGAMTAGIIDFDDFDDPDVDIDKAIQENIASAGTNDHESGPLRLELDCLEVKKSAYDDPNLANAVANAKKNLILRGEHLQGLDESTRKMADKGHEFKDSATELRKQMERKSKRWW